MNSHDANGTGANSSEGGAELASGGPTASDAGRWQGGALNGCGKAVDGQHAWISSGDGFAFCGWCGVAPGRTEVERERAAAAEWQARCEDIKGVAYAEAVERCAKVAADYASSVGVFRAVVSAIVDRIRNLSPQAGTAEGAPAFGTDLGKRYDAMPTPPTESAALAEKVPCARCDKNSVAEAHSRNCPIRVRERAERQAAAPAPAVSSDAGGADTQTIARLVGHWDTSNRPRPTPPTESAAARALPEEIALGACPSCGTHNPSDHYAACRAPTAASPEPPCSKCGSTTEPRSACAGCRKVFCRPCAEKPYAFCCDGRASPEGEGAPPCWACDGKGHFSEWGKPSADPEDRDCLECQGGRVPRLEADLAAERARVADLERDFREHRKLQGDLFAEANARAHAAERRVATLERELSEYRITRSTGKEWQARVATLTEALERRVRKGCNDTCSNMLSAEYLCDCGQTEALAALRSTRGTP